MSTSEAVKMSVEQMCRDLLAKAIADELVSPAQSYNLDADPQKLTSGDLCGVANLLADMLKRSATAAIIEREGNLQRYKFSHTADGGDITPDDDGKFVAYEDAQAAITAAKATIAGLRELLALSYSGFAHLYTDDGELQDNRQPPIDFVRDSVDEIERKIAARNAALAASATQDQAEAMQGEGRE
jgi:hypothetical protein